MQNFITYVSLDCFCDNHFTKGRHINSAFFLVPEAIVTGNASHSLFLPGNMYLSRDNVVAHIVREIFPVATVASNNSLPSQICRLFKLCLIDARSIFFDDLSVEP